ncbi:MAG: MFS transporter [archaeon]|nr:MFS transporter [archaeon]
MAQLYSVIEDRKTLISVMVLLALSTLIDGLDSTIVNVALPTMSKDFGISIADSSWIAVAYTVALASLILPFSRIARNGWMKEFFIAGTVVFTVCSVLCGILGDFLLFTLSRLFQGVGGAMMTAAVPLMIVHLLPHDRKGLGMAILGMASGLAVVLGPTIGGLITAYLSWNWIFFINVPLGAVIVLWAMKVVPGTDNHSEYTYPDTLNCILTFMGICFGLTFLQNIFETDLDTSVVYLCVVGAVVCISLMAWRSHSKKETAIISSAMIFRKDFALLCLAFTMTTIIIAGTHYVLPFYLEHCEGYVVSEVGYLLSIASLFTIVLSIPVGKWCDRKGCKVPAVGAGLFRLVFTLIFAVTAANMDLIFLVVGLAVMGISMACAGTGLATSIIHHSDEKYQDEAATFLLVVNYVAASFGVALTSLVYTINTSGSFHAGEVLCGFESCMWFFVALAVVAIACALVVPNVVPKKNKE